MARVMVTKSAKIAMLRPGLPTLVAAARADGRRGAALIGVLPARLARAAAARGSKLAVGPADVGDRDGERRHELAEPEDQADVDVAEHLGAHEAGAKDDSRT